MRKIRFVALLLALALLLCACGAAKTPLEQAAVYLKKATPNPGYGSLNGDWTVFGLARSGVQVAGKYYETYYGNVEAASHGGGRQAQRDEVHRVFPPRARADATGVTRAAWGGL